MIETKEGIIYATVGEKDIIRKLYRIKQESAVYFKNGVKIAYHWNLSPFTLGKLQFSTK